MICLVIAYYYPVFNIAYFDKIRKIINLKKNKEKKCLSRRRRVLAYLEISKLASSRRRTFKHIRHKPCCFLVFSLYLHNHIIIVSNILNIIYYYKFLSQESSIKVFDYLDLKNLFTASQTAPSNNTNCSAATTSCDLGPVERPVLCFRVLQPLHFLY